MLEKLVSLEQGQNQLLERVSSIEQNMANKEDIAQLNKELLAVSLEIIDYTKKIDAKLDILNDRTFEQEVDIRLLKKAR